MIELSPEIIAILMLGGLLMGVLTGFPLGIVVGAVALIVGYLIWGGAVGELIYLRMYKLMTNYILLAVPLFVFMGLVLERSGIAKAMYDALYLFLSGFRGGLAISTVLIGTIMAATVGVFSASVTMLAIIALPSMVNRKYSKSLASGSVCAGGCLGILIPPSVMLVVYGEMAALSVGRLFMAAFIPGLLLSALYIVYISLRCLFQREAGPGVPPEERSVTFLKKFVMLITSMVPPAVLILSVLGSIFMGIAAPTEAAGIGAFAAVILAAAYRRLNWQVLMETAIDTLRVCGMIFVIGTMSFAFTGVFLGAGGGDAVQNAILIAPGGCWGAFIVIMVACFILGMFIDWLGIVFIMVPILSPIIPVLGFDPLWFGMMICINLQMAFMSPPFAPAIYFVLGVAPRELGVTMGDAIRGVIPFILLIILTLGLCVAFPELILWLPSKMIR